MRVMFVSDLYPPHYLGGYELMCQETADEFARRGHCVSVLTTRWAVNAPKVEGNVHRLLHCRRTGGLERQGEEPDRLRLARRYRQLRWAVQSRSNYSIARSLLAAVKPDVIFVWNMGMAGIQPVLAAQRRGIPTAYSLMDYWLATMKGELSLDPSSLKRRYRAAINGMSCFGELDLRHLLALSQALKQHYVELGFPERDIRVIRPGIPSHLVLADHVLAQEPRRGMGPRRLLFAGRLDPDKAVDVAVKALGVVVRDMGVADIGLDIVGGGAEGYVRELRDLVAALQLESQVAFRGKMQRRWLLDHYGDYDALLFTSRWAEPLGVTILEAMARGLPVIATDRGGIPEVIADGENGLLVPADEPMAVAQAVARLMGDSDLVHRIRLAALRTIRERHNHERAVDQVLEFLGTVVESSLSSAGGTT